MDTVESEYTQLESSTVAQIRATIDLGSATAPELLPLVLTLERQARAAGLVLRAPLVMAALYPGSVWARLELVLA